MSDSQYFPSSSSLSDPTVARDSPPRSPYHDLTREEPQDEEEDEPETIQWSPQDSANLATQSQLSQSYADRIDGWGFATALLAGLGDSVAHIMSDPLQNSSEVGRFLAHQGLADRSNLRRPLASQETMSRVASIASQSAAKAGSSGVTFAKNLMDPQTPEGAAFQATTSALATAAKRTASSAVNAASFVKDRSPAAAKKIKRWATGATEWSAFASMSRSGRLMLVEGDESWMRRKELDGRSIVTQEDDYEDDIVVLQGDETSEEGQEMDEADEGEEEWSEVNLDSFEASDRQGEFATNTIILNDARPSNRLRRMDTGWNVAPSTTD